MSGYAELVCTTNFSFLTGASHPEELVVQARDLNYAALAITDECSLAGVVKAYAEHKENPGELRLIIGARFRLESGGMAEAPGDASESGNPHDTDARGDPSELATPSNEASAETLSLVLLATDREAYAELSGLITLGRRRRGKGDYFLTVADVTAHIHRCLAILTPTDVTLSLEQQARALLAPFAGRLWLGLSLTQQDDDYQRFRRYHAAARRLGLPLTACGDVLMHTPERKPLLDVLTAIRLNTHVQALGHRAQKNAGRCLRPLVTLERLYPPALLAETLKIAERCTFSLGELKYEYPDEIIPASWRAGRANAARDDAINAGGKASTRDGGHKSPVPETSSARSNAIEASEASEASDYLAELTWTGARRRWPDGIADQVHRQITAELALVRELGYEHFFLTVYDIVVFARSRGILCQGRGSAANSAVCFCLGITEVDPAKSQLLFERFLSKERNEPPDIDVDFEHERREEVIQYLYGKYGRERAALAAAVITYRSRSALRDVGKALGMDAALLDHLAKSMAWWDTPADLVQRLEEAGVTAASRTAQQLMARLAEIRGFPRHLSQHVGGFVIARGPVSALVPVENAAMAERSVIQWDKDDLESLGLLKVDVLALGMLTAIRKTFALIEQHGGPTLTMAALPPEDPAVYNMLCRADSVGVFQVESRAQMSMLPRLKPRTFYDLVVQVAIVRPGPIQGGMVTPYLARRAGKEPMDLPNEAVREVLARTWGVPIFQEQVIKMTMVAAGFTGGEADQLRRAMASWKLQGKLAPFEQKLKDGMRARGYASDYADRLWQQILGFGEYGFPESHAASFALLVYVSSWLKCHHPAAFCCGLLNSLPMGFYSPSQLLQDAARHGIGIRPLRVEHSAWDHTLERGPDGALTIRLGLRVVSGFNAAAAERLVAARQQARFRNLQDVKERGALSRLELEALIAADALAQLSGHRSQSQWDAAALAPVAPLLSALERGDTGHLQDGVARPLPSAVADVLEDYQSTGLTLKQHPLQLLRAQKLFQRCTRAADLVHLAQGRFVRIAGIVTGRQRPGTAQGIIFVTLEDETGSTNVVVKPDVQLRCRQALLGSHIALVKGIVENRDGVVHVLAGHIEDVSAMLRGLEPGSRDFH